MTMNASGPQVLESPRDREDLADGGGSAHTVAQATDDAHQGDALFPAEPAPLIARPLVLITRGRTEFLARCPHCKNMHRHTHLGTVSGPCGAEYELQPKAKLRGAA